MFKYSTPGKIVDITDAASHAAFAQRWHDYIHRQFKDNIDALGPASLFFSEVTTEAEGAPIPIHWNGFPLIVLRDSKNIRRDAWINAEVLDGSSSSPFRRQDEYCEWFVYQEAGVIKRIVFTAEGGQYWEQLADHDISTVVRLYQKYVNADVQKADLLKGGTYNPRNAWNTARGVMHLTHPANTLGAEINLAAVATLPRKDVSGQRVGDVRRLACCSNFGDPNRSSDPNIGYAVNTTCLPVASGSAAQLATLADPVGLYIDRLLPQTLTGPGNVSVDHWFSFVRGTAGQGLMAVLEAPAGSSFGLDQVKVKGVPLQWGGQVAEHIEMVLYAKVAPLTGTAPAPVFCVRHCCMPAGTTPAAMRHTNFDHVPRNSACDAGSSDAYPELIKPRTPGIVAAALQADSSAPSGKALLSRLASE